MGQSRLTSLAIMNTEREETLKLETEGLESLVTKFNDMEKRRLLLK